jgi:prepilin-type N-terminal cleavage/methylation domain-containing protein
MKGFTLLELVLVLVILGVLSGFTLTQLNRIERARIEFIMQCQTAYSEHYCIEQWKSRK